MGVGVRMGVAVGVGVGVGVEVKGMGVGVGVGGGGTMSTVTNRAASIVTVATPPWTVSTPTQSTREPAKVGLATRMTSEFPTYFPSNLGGRLNVMLPLATVIVVWPACKLSPLIRSV